MLVEFDVAILIFLVVNWCMGKTFSIKIILLSLIGWESVGNSNWYIFATLFCYISLMLAFAFSKLMKVSKEKFELFMVILTTLLLLFYTIIILKFKYSFWVDTIFCFSFGMIYSIIHRYLEKWINKKEIYYYYLLVGSIICFVISYSYYRHVWSIYVYNVCSILFVFVIVLLMMKISLNSPVLRYFGRNVFGFYILQRIAYILLEDLNLNKYIFVLVAFVLTMIFNEIFKRMINAVMLLKKFSFINRIVENRKDKGVY